MINKYILLVVVFSVFLPTQRVGPNCWCWDVAQHVVNMLGSAILTIYYSIFSFYAKFNLIFIELLILRIFNHHWIHLKF